MATAMGQYLDLVRFPVTVTGAGRPANSWEADADLATSHDYQLLFQVWFLTSFQVRIQKGSETSPKSFPASVQMYPSQVAREAL